MEMTQLGTERASFDLTDFGSAEAFQRVLDETGMEMNDDYSDKGWEFLSDEVVMHVYANPLTGVRAGMPDRTPEPGYASYIHIQGEVEAVEELYDAIEREATYIKGHSLGRWNV